MSSLSVTTTCVDRLIKEQLDIDEMNRKWIAERLRDPIADFPAAISVATQQQDSPAKEQQQRPKIARQTKERVISKACREVLDNPKATIRQKLQAAALLEKVMRTKVLAGLSRIPKKSVRSAAKGQLDDILRRTGTD